LDVARLRESFARVAMHGDELPLFFYSDLFIKHPEVRDLFPVSMAAQRGHLVDALVKIVSQVDSVDDLTLFLQGLGGRLRACRIGDDRGGARRRATAARLVAGQGRDL
jgi:hemoglobin-like flavoprotein